MPFTAGDLCCPQDMCVAIDTNPAASQADYEVIQHVTQIQWTQTANTAKIVTSSTGGNETSVCGPVSNTGTLNLACHSGTGPLPLGINKKYNIMWGLDCEWVEQLIAEEAPDGPTYWAKIRIVSVNQDLNPAAGGAVIASYGFEVVEWIDNPVEQSAELDD